jgi:hypothetical protein
MSLVLMQQDNRSELDDTGAVGSFSASSRGPLRRPYAILFSHVHGLHLAGDKDKEGLVCLPVGLTGEEARAAFVRVMRSFGKGPNPFTEGPIDAALLAALGMTYRCPKTSN